MIRRKYLPAQSIEKLKKLTLYLDMSKASQTFDEIKANIIAEIKVVAEGRNQNAVAINDVSDTYTMSVIKEIAPEVAYDMKPQSQRRLEALVDLFNHVSMAAIVPAIWLRQMETMILFHQIIFLILTKCRCRLKVMT